MTEKWNNQPHRFLLIHLTIACYSVGLGIYIPRHTARHTQSKNEHFELDTT